MSRRIWAALLSLMLAGVTVWGNYGKLSRYVKASWRGMSEWGERPYRSGGTHVNEARDLVNPVPPGSGLVFLTDLRTGITPVGRIVHIGLSWAMGPDRVEIADTADGLDDTAFLLLSDYALPRFSRPPGDYALVRRVGSATLWHKEASAPLQGGLMRNLPVSRWREARGLLAPVVVFAGGMLLAGWTGALFGVLVLTLGMVLPPALGVCPMPWVVAVLAGAAILVIGSLRHRLRENTGPLPCPVIARAWLAGTLMLAALAVLTLGHTFFAPNGLGVYGGKARLLYLAHGLPSGFFTDTARATLQPAYPPGFALLTLGCYGLAGGCGEYLTQLVGCLFMVGVAVFLMRFAGSWWSLVWVASSFFTSQVIQMGTLFYAEPLMVLMALVGWERLRTGHDDLPGWLLLGAAGWIKNEGILILPSCWFTVRVVAGKHAASVPYLFAALALPLFWHVGCRLAGGGLYDYAVWPPHARQAMAAAGCLLRLAFREPWRYGCAYPLMALGWLLPPMRTRAFAIVNIMAVVMLIAFVWIFALSRAGDFRWHLNSMERLLWLPALLLVREVLAACQTTHGPPGSGRN